MHGGGQAAPMPQGGMPAAPQFPSADPSVIAQMLGQIMQVQHADQAQLVAAQHAALVQNPIMAALLGGDASGTAVGAQGMTPGDPAPGPNDPPGGPYGPDPTQGAPVGA